MNKQQKEVLQTQLSEEERILKWLKQTYDQAAKDTSKKIAELSTRTDFENIQSIVYQKQYQEAILKQIQGTLEQLNSDSFLGISDYLAKCYENGYVGAMYDLHGQGIPIIMPIDQKQVVRALETDSKLSEGLYTRLGEDTKFLKKKIKAELSRGIIEGKSYNDIAKNIAGGMTSPFKVASNNAMRIARTEGHRVQLQSQNDALYKAKDKGADIVKQWDSTLDGRTRESHRVVDGEIRELDDKFSNGLMFPSDPHGAAAEVVNCRCALLQRAKWNLDQDELNILQKKAEFFGLDKTENFEEFKAKYLNLPEDSDNINIGVLSNPIKSNDSHYDACLSKLDQMKVDYNPVQMHKSKMTEEDIINALAGGDKTQGSCASVGLAYIGQKQGWDVLDFRGSSSREFFSNGLNLHQISLADGINAIREKGKCSLTVGSRLLQHVEEGKEYYLCTGRHASIVRKQEGVLQYLELQSATRSGWTDFNGNPKFTLSSRFGCSQTSTALSELYDFMIDIDNSNFNTDDFKSLIGYINTNESEQRKGAYGTIK